MSDYFDYPQDARDTRQPTSPRTLLDDAINCALSVHMGQIDKAGRDYVTSHVKDVVDRLDPDDDMGRIVAWLHDVVEDGAPDVWFGIVTTFPSWAAAAVDAITHRRYEARSDYYARVKANPLALRVKLADIASNTDPERMALLDDETRARLTEKYRKALEALK